MFSRYAVTYHITNAHKFDDIIFWFAIAKKNYSEKYVSLSIAIRRDHERIVYDSVYSFLPLTIELFSDSIFMVSNRAIFVFNVLPIFFPLLLIIPRVILMREFLHSIAHLLYKYHFIQTFSLHTYRHVCPFSLRSKYMKIEKVHASKKTMYK